MRILRGIRQAQLLLRDSIVLKVIDVCGGRVKLAIAARRVYESSALVR